MVEGNLPYLPQGARERENKEITLKMNCNTCFERFDSLDHTPMYMIYIYIYIYIGAYHVDTPCVKNA